MNSRDLFIARLTEQISVLSEVRLELTQASLWEKSGFTKGDLITWKTRTSARRGRIEGVFEFCGRPAFRVQSVRKDGSLGDHKLMDIYYYHEPTKVQT